MTDLNGGNIEANDIIKYHIEIVNTGNSIATGVNLLDDIPLNVHNFTITTLPVSGSNNSTPAPAGANGNGKVDFSNMTIDAAGGPNDHVIVEYTVQVNIS